MDSATDTPSPTAQIYRSPLATLNRLLAVWGMHFAVTGLLVIIVIVAYQVFGRYVMNDSPTWAESLALVLVLYVTLIGAAVGVRDAGHLGMESLLVLLKGTPRRIAELCIHVLVGAFGIAMVYNGWVLGETVLSYKLANLGISEAYRYAPLVISGALVSLFSLEHVLAILSHREVEHTWH